MEDLLVRYGIALGRRYSQKQKKKFLVAMSQEFAQLGYTIKYANDDKKGSRHSIDLFIGDIASAHTIIFTHYDTGSQIIWPNFKYYPLHGEKSMKAFRNATLIPPLVFTLIAVTVIYALMNMITLNTQTRPILLTGLVFFGLLGISYLSTGFGNRYNLNKNTASILTLLEIAKNLAPEERHKIAFMLLDHGNSDNMGAQMIRLALPTTLEKRLFVYLDCIGRGDNIRIGYKANLAINARKMKENYQGKKKIEILECDTKRFIFKPTHFLPQSLTVSCGKLDENNELYVDQINSGKDNFIETANILEIAHMIINTFTNNKPN